MPDITEHVCDELSNRKIQFNRMNYPIETVKGIPYRAASYKVGENHATVNEAISVIVEALIERKNDTGILVLYQAAFDQFNAFNMSRVRIGVLDD